jgi:hypothetical protein
MTQTGYEGSVFINCPFDSEYQALFYAVIFAVQDCGFWPRCALEINDSGTVRIEKIFQIIERCKFGIHDISRTETSGTEPLPRFNMPLELGLFLGAKRFGQGKQAEKLCLILDREPHRYQRFCSDIAGQDIQTHNREPEKAIRVVRNWLAGAVLDDGILPGGANIAERYDNFCEDLPIFCDKSSLKVEELIFVDFRKLVIEWLEINERSC